MFLRGTFITESTLTSFMTTNGIKTTKKKSGFWRGQLSGASWSLTWLQEKGREWKEERGRRDLGQRGSPHRFHFHGGRAGAEVGPAGMGDIQAFHHQRGEREALLRPQKLMAGPV